MAEYVELHAHSHYSFLEGASSIEEMTLRARELGYPALALTDHDNLVGAMAFSKAAQVLEVRPITGAEVTLAGGGHLTLLAETARGYANLCHLLTLARVTTDRREPELDPRLLPEHAEGLVLLTGCPQGPLPRALTGGRVQEAERLLAGYREWFGERVYLEAQRNLVHGERPRIRALADLAKRTGVPLVATNNAHYHVPERHRLQDCLVAIRHRTSLEASHRLRRPNAEFHLKPAGAMARLFRELPQAVSNTLAVAERCAFGLADGLTYRFPTYPTPDGSAPLRYLERLCREAAVRRYGAVEGRVAERLTEELRRIERHDLAGFFLIYRDIIELAREVQVELGLVDREIPIEEAPPGRGRGSSVAMLVGYLIGLSHIDPLTYELSLDRFLPDGELGSVPDIDLDFPREIRERLILRVHEKWGWEHAALTGMVPTYQARGAIRDLGMALGLPPDEVDKLAKRVERATASGLRAEMDALPEFAGRADAPGWRTLVELAAELDGTPRTLAQHPGGMIISSTPLSEQVPVQPGAMEGRYVCQWDKDAIDDAGFVKIDFLALGTLSQLQEATRLIERRTGHACDLSRIDFEDPVVYGMLGRGDTIGIFQVESAAQRQTIPRIRPANLVDMAHEVAAVRPGVGANDGVSLYIRRRSGEPWDYDHPLEREALERTLGVILFQDQVNQLAMDVGGMSPREADQLRRAFGRRNNRAGVLAWWERFREGAAANGLDEQTARAVFLKFNGQYMFPESHAFAFGVTAYQAAWLKAYWPLEFFVGLFNQQPMGFYSLETLKEDARRHGVLVMHPDVNRSAAWATPEGDALRLGLAHVRSVGQAAADAVLGAREAGGPFADLASFMERTGLVREALEQLTDAGALDGLCGGERRRVRWEVGLRYVPVGSQRSLGLPVAQDMAALPRQTALEAAEGEYRSLGVHPEGHLLAHLRPALPAGTLTSEQVDGAPDGSRVRVAGLVVRRQRPAGKAVFLTLEDECGHTPLVVWPAEYARLRHALREPVLVVEGTVSRREGTMNVVVSAASAVRGQEQLGLRSKDWG
jgi:error-prone DNA polymerase